MTLSVRFRDQHGLTHMRTAATCAKHAAAVVTPAEQLATNRDGARALADGDSSEKPSASDPLWSRIAFAATGSVHRIVDTTTAELTNAVDSPAHGDAVSRQCARVSRACVNRDEMQSTGHANRR